MIWKKDQHGNVLIVDKAPLSYFEDISVFFKRYDSTGSHPLRDYFAKVQAFIGKPKRDIIADIGQRADHVFRGDSSQFALCTAETYNALIEHYGIDKSETMAFGDGQNDVDMFAAVGTAVAMGNACRAAKEAADYITDPVDEDGIWNALKHFGVL